MINGGGGISVVRSLNFGHPPNRRKQNTETIKDEEGLQETEKNPYFEMVKRLDYRKKFILEL